MKEVIITSSVLIAVILLARWLFRGKVSQRLIYAAWLLVALRLLIPVQFGHSQYSVTSLAEKAEAQSQPIQQVQQALKEPVSGPSRAELYEQLLGDYLQENPTPDAPEIPSLPNRPVNVTPEVQQTIEAQVEAQITAPTLGEILTAVWIIGMCAMAGWFVTANLMFLYRAKKNAVAADFGGGRIRISPNVPTPCVVGLFRPIIYLTPTSAEIEQTRAHVLAHEQAHLRHGDHIWALVRCICLCIYWFNPLVWIAAAQSRRDCELACDESALKALGDAHRIAYGKTLLDVVSQSMSPVHLLETATAMNESKKQLKERVNYIVRKPRNILIAAICMILVASITAGCAFLGSSPKAPTAPTDPPTQTTDPTRPDTPPGPTQPDTPLSPDYVPMVPDSPVQQTAEALVTGYTRYMSLGLCCSYEQVSEDMSAYLSDTQKQNYHNWQYRITCCHSAQEVHNHIDRTLSKDLQIRDDITDRLFTDNKGQLYLIVIPMGAVVYRNVTAVEADGRLYAKSGAYDEDGWFADAYFTIENQIITQVARTDHDEIPSYAENLTFPLHLGTIFDNPHSWYRRALTSEYTTPADANIAHFFSQGFPDEGPITDEEWKALKDIPNFQRNGNLHRLPTGRMDQALSQVFGLTLGQMNSIGTEKLHYLESTGCYYLMGGEDIVSELHFSEGPKEGINHYTNSKHEPWTVYITMTKDGPKIQQNYVPYANQVLQTTKLSKEHLGMSRLEFLYTSTLMLQEKMKAEGWSEKDIESVYWNAHSIKNRKLYLEDGVLMMMAQYSFLAAPEDPLHRTIYAPYQSPQVPTDLEAQSYLWLFKIERHTDGYISDAYATLLLDCAFTAPDTFLQYLAEFDEDTISNCSHLLYYGILSQEEADLYARLLTALSSRADLNAREQRTLEFLAQVPDWFPYSIAPELAPKVQGNAATIVSGQDPELPNGLMTTPPANTLTHTHVYTDTTVAPTCVVKGYDYHLCHCGAYYCDNFKGIIAHNYQLSGVGAIQTPTYDDPGYHTMECQLCGDRYLEEVPAGKDLDLAAIIAKGEAYASSLGFQIVSAEEWNHPQAAKESITLSRFHVYSAYHDAYKPLTEWVTTLIDRLAYERNYKHLYVLCIKISPFENYSQTLNAFSITVTLGHT